MTVCKGFKIKSTNHKASCLQNIIESKIHEALNKIEQTHGEAHSTNISSTGISLPNYPSTVFQKRCNFFHGVQLTDCYT